VGADPLEIRGRPMSVGSDEQQNPTGSTGVVAAACMKEEIVSNTGSLGGEGA
jgi:hypothetical protein